MTLALLVDSLNPALKIWNRVPLETPATLDTHQVSPILKATQIDMRRLQRHPVPVRMYSSCHSESRIL